jgi:hypothetical protein
VVLILFDLDLKIYLNGLENKCKRKEKKRRKTYLLPAAWRPALVSLLLPFLAVGPSRTEPVFPALPHACVGRPKEQPWPRVPLSSVADG